MLDVKKLLTKILQSMMVQTVDVNSAPVTINANTTQWVNVPAPSGYNVITLAGYYTNGSSLCLPYCVRYNNDSAQFAFRNTATSSHTFTLTVRFLVWGGTA